MFQGEFCDPKSHTGYINYYVRCVRSRSADIVTRWTHAKKRKLYELHFFCYGVHVNW